MLKLLCLLPVLTALGLEFRRLVPVWFSSPLDRLDFIWPAAGIAVLPALLFLHAGSRRAVRSERMGWFFLVPMLAVAAFGRGRHFNVVYFAGLLGTAVTLIWALWGWRPAWRLLPVALLVLLGTPTSAVTVFSPTFCDWATLKLGTAAVIAGWTVAAEFLPLTPRWENGIFYLALGALFFCSLFDTHPVPLGNAIQLNSGATIVGNYVGSSQTLSAFDRRFFAGCRSVRRSIWFGKDGAPIFLLEVVSGGSVHNVHAPEVCLRSGGWTVESKRRKNLEIDGRVLSCEELTVKADGRLMLVFVWYADGTVSTGSFLYFRRHWTPAVPWRIYQLMVPFSGDYESAEKRMIGFISRLMLRE